MKAVLEKQNMNSKTIHLIMIFLVISFLSQASFAVTTSSVSLVNDGNHSALFVPWQTDSNTIMQLSGQNSVQYKRNGALYPGVYGHTELPTQVGYKYTLEIIIEKNSNRVDLQVDGKSVAALVNSTGIMRHEFIAKRTKIRISIGGTYSYQAQFLISGVRLISSGGYVTTGTYVGGLFVEEMLEFWTPDLKTRLCQNNQCQLKLGIVNNGSPHILRIYLAEIYLNPVSFSAGSNVTGVYSNFASANLYDGLYVEISFFPGTKVANVSLRKSSWGYVLHFDGKF